MITKDNSNRRKPRRAQITKIEERLIYEYSTKFYPNMGREELARKMQNEIKWPGKTPEPEGLLGKISTYRKHGIDSPLDQPWHMGTLKDYPQTPKGLAAIVVAHRFAAQHGATLTIRQAAWIGRLYAVPKRLFPGFSDEDTDALLIIWALQYASSEIWSEVSKEPFDTTSLDYALHLGPPPGEGYTLKALAADFLKGREREAATLRQWYKDPSNKDTILLRKEIEGIVGDEGEVDELLNLLARRLLRERLVEPPRGKKSQKSTRNEKQFNGKGGKDNEGN